MNFTVEMYLVITGCSELVKLLLLSEWSSGGDFWGWRAEGEEQGEEREVLLWSCCWVVSGSGHCFTKKSCQLQQKEKENYSKTRIHFFVFILFTHSYTHVLATQIHWFQLSSYFRSTTTMPTGVTRSFQLNPERGTFITKSQLNSSPN